MRFRIRHILAAMMFLAAWAGAFASNGDGYELYGVFWMLVPVLGVILMMATLPLLLLQRARPWWFAIWIAIPCLFAGRQYVLSQRLHKLRDTVNTAIAYLDEQFRTYGAYPHDLQNFTPDDPGLMQYIRYEVGEPARDDYWLTWHPMHPDEHDIEHGYDPDSGHWFTDD
jgi:hypothetical protein